MSKQDDSQVEKHETQKTGFNVLESDLAVEEPKFNTLIVDSYDDYLDHAKKYKEKQGAERRRVKKIKQRVGAASFLLSAAGAAVLWNGVSNERSEIANQYQNCANLLDESDIGGQTVSFDELDEDIMGVCRIEDALNSRNGSSKTSIRLPDNLAGQIIFDQNSGEPAFVQVPSAENYRSSAESLGGFYEDYRPVKAITISILCGAVFLNASVVMVNLANPLPENRPR